MRDMTDAVVAQVTLALSSPQPCWMPGLAERLVQSWHEASRTEPSSYGTSRFVGGPSCRPSWTQELRANGKALTCLEVMASAVEDRYSANGLSFLSTEEVVGMPKGVFYEALSAASMPATLLACVIKLAKTTHLLRSAGEGMDVSHSDPALPFSVFVSTPAPQERFTALRLAESFVHESMHLQLSLIERVIPMVRDNETTYHSPWRDGHRPVGGVLHGLYVFAAIHEWLTLRGPNCTYAEQRLPEISSEVEQLESFPEEDGLTQTGAQFARRMVDSVLVAAV
ncbi:hypothetical protein CLM74_06375 [Stenotrophomonas sp. MYb57]|uniref:aKG-HExxH-type peptide beta-hydroxylase n=1 Tax=Stenotrophomonas sp. MYb57 TaxID=1827305 RepID=UPI000CF69F01|nr:HEXXH motif-containing putative peptide modification protein [Stenotrophomonas sp. MYb57]AVJ32429.1 hypothetical protein CLM74_06375 [Stenotrophomonas sp. MYb57]